MIVSNLIIRVVIFFALSEKFLDHALSFFYSEVKIAKPKYLIEPRRHVTCWNVKQTKLGLNLKMLDAKPGFILTVSNVHWLKIFIWTSFE